MDKNVSEEVQKKINQLRNWIDSQPHLPKDVGKNKICYYDVEKTKVTIELFFKVRDSAPELVNHRDPLSPAMQKAMKIANVAQYEISGNRNIWLWQLNDPGLEQYDYIQDARMFIMTCDAWMLSNDQLAEEDIVDAMPIRLKQIHIINAPPFIDKLFSMMKPFLKQEVTNMVHFHVPKSDTLYKYLNKEDLPSDYGGSRPSMEELNKRVVDIVMEKRKIFLDENFWKTEKKGKKVKESTTFRSLDID
ncbi:hypothetical protein HF086_000930 [Spodoptera exigua]|uniref:CRAL-TRIO domain-containing protein n=1 Tax=Spodoptera exigua TaxID=7107 RepID=A0A922M8J8_SPOEX|nr:hypothetical protein HF086_000930 [Spodoptera exigua]